MVTASTGVQTLVENSIGYLGLLQQIGPAGTFSGEIDGLIPVGGYLELQYPETKLGPYAVSDTTICRRSYETLMILGSTRKVYSL